MTALNSLGKSFW